MFRMLLHASAFGFQCIFNDVQRFQIFFFNVHILTNNCISIRIKSGAPYFFLDIISSHPVGVTVHLVSAREIDSPSFCPGSAIFDENLDSTCLTEQ